MNNFSIDYLTGKLDSRETNIIRTVTTGKLDSREINGMPTFTTNQVNNLTKVFPEVSYDYRCIISHRSSPPSLSMSSSLSSPSSISSSSSSIPSSPESLSSSSSLTSSSTETNGIPMFSSKQVCNFNKKFPDVSYDYKSTTSHRSSPSLVSVPYSSLSPSSTSSSPPSSTPSSQDSLSPSSSLLSSPTTSSEKPAHSYIALISMSILNSPEKKVLLGDIYQYIMDNFPYYNNKEKAWRNSIRHNLSLNECFIKNGRADNGKGNYWSIHPACIEDFSRGDFRRRQARRRARKNTMAEMSMSKRPMSYQYDIGYVPMTTSTLPFGSPMCYPQSHFTPMTQGLGYQAMATLPRAMAASVSYTMSTNPYQSYQSYLPRLQV